MRVLHQSIVLEDGLPILIILLVFAYQLLDGDLMAEIVLENEVTEVRCLRVFPELNVNEGLSWSLN